MHNLDNKQRLDGLGVYTYEKLTDWVGNNSDDNKDEDSVGCTRLIGIDAVDEDVADEGADYCKSQRNELVKDLNHNKYTK